ncbi:hypothetical protein OQX61_08405 [Pedobacter sp. PLR]|uniref:hypothetical protein n=1 Tax=Pedobacter sp. PLR TaxID=2994465 RepID=UPI002245D937|nr:hypothetical protein [Pedobacter sp. PLR]MCX2451290.1 hypothetical protein [Pedobacter sp. PLR]
MTYNEAQQLVEDYKHLIGKTSTVTDNKLTNLLITPKPIYEHVVTMFTALNEKIDVSSFIEQYDDFGVLMVYDFDKFRSTANASVGDLETYLKGTPHLK